MKRSIALALVLVMVLAMIPAVSAATPEQTLTLSKVDPALEINTAQVVGEADRMYAAYAPSCVAPTFEMYGMTVLEGELMEVSFYTDLGSGESVVLLIYKGYYEDLNEESELVASGQTGDYAGVQTMYWDTTGCPAGDYTIYYAVVDAAGELVYATLADVFISDVEIPLEKLTFYVRELGMETEDVYVAVQRPMDSLTPHAVRHPYHTTDRRPVTMEGVYCEFNQAKSNFFGATSYVPPDYLTTLNLCAYIEEDGAHRFLSYLRVHVEEESDAHPKIYSESSASYKYICSEGETPIRVRIPEGFTMEDALVQASRPGLLSARIEGDQLYVTALTDRASMERLTIAFGQYYDCIEYYIIGHLYINTTLKEPTCTEDGLWAKKCRSCGTLEDETVLPKLGHDVAELTVVTEPTATKDGLGTGHCARCDLDVEVAVPRIFADTEPGRFYSDAVDYCYANGIIKGITANTFEPGTGLTRGQLVTMLYRHSGSPEVTEPATFADVPAGKYYSKAVAWASGSGVVNGYAEDNTFRPDVLVDRAQLVTMIHRYVKLLEKDNGQRADLAAFEDLGELPKYAGDAMRWAVANKVVNGMSATLLGPKQSATRAQTATILYRVISEILIDGAVANPEA